MTAPLEPRTCGTCGLRWTGAATDPCPSSKCPARYELHFSPGMARCIALQRALSGGPAEAADVTPHAPVDVPLLYEDRPVGAATVSVDGSVRIVAEFTDRRAVDILRDASARPVEASIGLFSVGRVRSGGTAPWAEARDRFRATFARGGVAPADPGPLARLAARAEELELAEQRGAPPDLAAIRDRITKLTLAAGLPRDAWAELCRIDSDFRALLRGGGSGPETETADSSAQKPAVAVPAGSAEDAALPPGFDPEPLAVPGSGLYRGRADGHLERVPRREPAIGFNAVMMNAAEPWPRRPTPRRAEPSTYRQLADRAARAAELDAAERQLSAPPVPSPADRLESEPRLVRAVEDLRHENRELRDRIGDLESAILEWVAANDAPASSGDRGEGSVWLARTNAAQLELRELVDAVVSPELASCAGVTPGATEFEAAQQRARANTLESQLTSLTEQHDVWRSRAQQLAVRVETLEGICRRLEDEACAWETKCDDARARVATLESECDEMRSECNDAADRDTEIYALRRALIALIARIRSTGGYATPEEQQALWQAEQLLATGAAPSVGLGPIVEPATGEPACARCGVRLMFSARLRGGGLCGPCSRGTAYVPRWRARSALRAIVDAACRAAWTIAYGRALSSAANRYSAAATPQKGRYGYTPSVLREEQPPRPITAREVDDALREGRRERDLAQRASGTIRRGGRR